MELVLTDQLSVFSLPILIGSIIITVLVCSYVKAMQKREAAMEKLEYETNHDNLTALLNYRAFSNYVIQITNQAKVNYTILMIYLDNFKRVNDQFGHLEGNHLLQAFAKKLRLYFEVRYHEKVRVFRFGGEEFCIVLKGVTIDDAYATIWEFEELLKKEDYLTTGGQSVVISFSGGIARADQENNIHEAIRNADAAVYLAKSNGRAQIICPDCSID
jgi:diguanylate cyclase (GGDEF)-like protein